MMPGRLRRVLAALAVLVVCGVLSALLTANPALAAAGDFITTWDTTQLSAGSTDDHSVHLPLTSSGTYSFTVDWGDGGPSDTITSWDQAETTHTYGTPGTYTVTVSGTLRGWQFDGGGDRLKLTDISQWGDMALGNGGHYFEGAAMLSCSATDSPDLTGTTTFEGIFANANSFTGNIGSWDVSGITNMSQTFAGAISFNRDLTGWDVSNVTTMSGMFWNANAFNGDISSWDVGSVTDMSHMFTWAYSFNGDISGWDVGSVTTMNDMFSAAFAFNQPIGGWDTGHVTNMSSMFSAAVDFNQPLAAWSTGSVTTMAGMFASASDFNQPLAGWDTSQVTDMSSMFHASDFDQPLAAWNTGSVTTMSAMFQYNSSFDQPIGSWDTSSLTDTSAMFYGATVFNQDLTGWDTSKVLDMRSMFEDAAAFNGDVSTWDTGSVTTLMHTFAQAVAFNCDVSAWDTGSVTRMEGTFAGALAFDQDLGAWDVGQVNDLHNFLNAVNLSVAHYNSLLNGWSSLPGLQHGVHLMAGGNHYTSVAAAGRAVLTGDYGWTVDDGGILNSEVGAGPNPADFGPQNFGFASRTTITVASTGLADLLLGPGALQLTGTDADQFAIVSQDCANRALAPSATCTVTAEFAPTRRGVASARIEVSSNAPGSPYPIQLAGTGVAADLTPTPTSVAFGDQMTGTRSPPQTVTLTNSGNTVLVIDPFRVTITGSNAAEFGITAHTCTGGLIPVDGACAVQIAFTPHSAGPKVAALSITSNAPGSPHSVPLSGTATTQPTPTPSPTPTPTPIPVPAAPSGLSARATRKAVKVSWLAVNQATSYRTTLRGKNTRGKKLVRSSTTNGPQTRFKVRLKKGSRYTVCVTASNTSGTSSRTCVKGRRR